MRKPLIAKGCGILPKGIFLLFDNAPAKYSHDASVKARWCFYELFKNPSNSSDLELSEEEIIKKKIQKNASDIERHHIMLYT